MLWIEWNTLNTPFQLNHCDVYCRIHRLDALQKLHQACFHKFIFVIVAIRKQSSKQQTRVKNKLPIIFCVFH